MRRFLIALLLVAATVSPRAAAPIRYRLSFPEPQHRWMQVEASFSELGSGTLELRMSRSSPGRYSLHDFAKNVYDVHAFASDGRELQTTRPDPYGWNVAGHGGTVTVKYKVFGDRVDGTYLGVDTTHAHINMPAAIMWAHGLDDRPVSLTFQQPAGMHWQVATQLHAGSSPLEFTAPNLQYLMDSPSEFGPVTVRQFTVDSHTFRFAVHHTGTAAELDDYVKDVEKIVRQEREIYGEYPAYEPGYYTFLADYLPYADGDGMEHRNSTVISGGRSIANGRLNILDTVAHEFFHCWNVERIRPKGLEPFDFDRANLSGELWLAEGFTQYYGPLALQRAKLVDLAATARDFTELIEAVAASGHLVRSAEEMSRMAPFIDGGRTVDRTNWPITVISYYPFGGALALALDLTLRDRSDNRLSLDDYMQAMWRKYGEPGGNREGYVDRPYTIADAEATLAEVSGDRAFAHEFFARYIEGHDIADYGRLLFRAGFAVRKRNPGRARVGDIRLEASGGASRVATLVAPTWPLYAAGIDQDDELQQVGGQRIMGDGDLATALQRHKPGDAVPIVYVDRTRVPKTATVTLAEDPHVEVVVGDADSAQREFRARWLGMKEYRSRGLTVAPDSRRGDRRHRSRAKPQDSDARRRAAATTAAARGRRSRRCRRHRRSAARRRSRRGVEGGVRSRHPPSRARTRAGQRRTRAGGAGGEARAGAPGRRSGNRPAAPSRRRRRRRMARHLVLLGAADGRPDRRASGARVRLDAAACRGGGVVQRAIARRRRARRVHTRRSLDPVGRWRRAHRLADRCRPRADLRRCVDCLRTV